MFYFSHLSDLKLKTCHNDLQTIARELIKIMDVTVLEGHRGMRKQNEYYDTGFSNARYPDSPHNETPSRAMDLAPYPIDWDDTERFERMCGIIEGIALAKNIKIRLGRDFKSIKDYPHIELV